MTHSDDVERISCRDNGHGMTFDHARNYLFTLYASSKEDQSNQAGRFGVGFWAILRFSPTRIIIRSAELDGPAWEVTLDGDLKRARRRSLEPMEPGTEIILERPKGDGDLARRVHDAAYQSARYLTQRDAPRKPLDIRVNNARVNAPFALPAPSVSFQRGPFRGVIGLGPAPRIELFSRGLRVRSAATLQDLLSAKGRHTDRSRVHFPDLPSGLAPQAILESADLEVLLSRGDVRDTRALRRLVRRAHQELTRLVNRQLALSRPWWARALESIRDRVGGIALGFALGALVTVPLAWWMLRDVPIGQEIGRLWSERGSENAAPKAFAYSDLAAAYRGPQVDVLPSAPTVPLALQYEPSDRGFRFAALVVDRLDRSGVPELRPGIGPYEGKPCLWDCVQVTLHVNAPPGVLRLPVPTGHGIDPESVRWNGETVQLSGASANGEPVMMLKRSAAGVIEYATGPTAPRGRPAIAEPLELPPEWRALTRSLRREAVSARVDTLVDLVRERVKYSNNAEVAARHHRAEEAGTGFVKRSLAIGAGDCDVQNGLLTSLLHNANVPARLVIGYIGVDGRVAPQLHAWVEYWDRGWRTADASRGSAPALGFRPAPDAPVVAAPIEIVPGGNPIPIPTLPPAPYRPHVAPTGTSTVAPRPPAGLVGVFSLSLVGLGLMLLGLGLLLPRMRTRRAFHLEPTQDVTELLKGALQRPEAFRHISALFHSRLVPRAGGSSISLLTAWELAARGGLFRSNGETRLGRRAIRRGLTVLDDAQPPGRAVAAALGAADLDYWDELLSRSRTPPLFKAINAHLRVHGESWSIHLVDGVPELLASLDVGRRGILPGGATRVIAIDQAAPWLKTLEQGIDTVTASSLFRALDLILDFVDLTEARRAELLSTPARAAVLEAGR